MAVTMAEISKLRKLTGAGMMDCKNALTETNGDIEAAKEIIRKKGQAVAAKREDREASEGCVLAAAKGDFAAIVALKCETDFVAKNESFVALTKSILNAAIEAKAADIEAVKALVIDGTPVANLIVDEIGKTYSPGKQIGHCCRLQFGRYRLSSSSRCGYAGCCYEPYRCLPRRGSCRCR